MVVGGYQEGCGGGRQRQHSQEAGGIAHQPGPARRHLRDAANHTGA